MPGLKRGSDVREERTAKSAGMVAMVPEIALESFEVRDLEILGHQVLNVGGEGFLGGTMLFSVLLLALFTTNDRISDGM